MKVARKQVAAMMADKSKKDFDEDEKEVDKHLSHDIKESKKSIEEDKKLKKKLRSED